MGGITQIPNYLYELGYTENMIKPDFPIHTEKHGTIRVGLAVFSDEDRQDFSTCCLVMDGLDQAEERGATRPLEAVFESALFLAAPRLVLINGQQAEVWDVRVERAESPLFTFEVTEAAKVLSQHRVDLSRDVLARLKTTRQQLTFFDYGSSLYDFAEKANAKVLSEAVEAAYLAGKQRLPSDPPVHLLKALTRLTVQMLAARVLEDKGKIPESPNLNDLFLHANQCFEGYFDLDDVLTLGPDVASAVLEQLQRNVNFAGVTNEILGHVYERALVNESTRKELNIFYTPRHVAERILDRLPIEDIPRDERSVLDGTCGSGSLLLAAYRRFNSLLPETWGPRQRHSWLNQRIHGIDTDEFAAAIAKLSLLLYSLPIGNHWHLEPGDFFDVAPTGKVSIIVGNPPFEETSNKARIEKAEKFVVSYLNLLGPGGLMGIVLPLPFLGKKSCRSIRRMILEQCELLEVWQLPTKVIELSNMELAVLLLRKKDVPDRTAPVRFNRVLGRQADLEQFLSGGRVTYSWLSCDQNRWLESKDTAIISSPFDHLWRRITSSARPLGKMVTAVTGASPAKKSDDHFSDVEKPGWRQFINGSRAVGTYQIDWKGQKKRRWNNYPNGLHRPAVGNDPIYRGPKVLVNGNHNPWNPWRFAAAVDRIGYLPRNSVWCVVPKGKDLNLEVIAAILNSPIASLWIDSFNYTRWINKDWLLQIPVPPMQPVTVERITALVRRAEESPTERLEIARAIDGLLFEAYGLTDEEAHLIESHFAGFPRFGINTNRGTESERPGRTLDHSPHTRTRIITGEVLSMNLAESMVTVRLRGVSSEPITDVIPGEMPGWVLRQGTLFRASVDRSLLGAEHILQHLRHYRPVEHSNMTLDQLRDDLQKNSSQLTTESREGN